MTDRREFLKALGLGAAALAAGACGKKPEASGGKPISTGADDPTSDPSKMTYRTNPTTGDRVSLLGFGCMRLPTIPRGDAGNGEDDIDQEMVNALVDRAIQGGVNYFDTAPVYCKGRSEHAMGVALSRHPRGSYFLATKLSNQSPEKWPRDVSLAIYEKSLKELKTDYLDYMLLHSVGNGAAGGMETLKGRFLDNGVLDFLVQERAAGRIRNLGFSYHGDVAVFDHLLERHDRGEVKWDFVQIQLNYVDWRHAKEVNPRNTDAEYLYGELRKRGIPAIVMEPLLGGRLAHLNFRTIQKLKSLDDQASVASWAFRFAGSHEGVLTVLSGMTYMEHLEENLRTYSPLRPLGDRELSTLEEAARAMLEFPLIPCTGCQYCMPCPYGLDIPAIFAHYNRCLNEGNYAGSVADENYRKARRAFLAGYDLAVPSLRQADRCVGCGKCAPHCPQRLDIPAEIRKVDRYAEGLKSEEG